MCFCILGMGILYQLKELISQSGHLAPISRGRELWSRVSQVLQDTIEMEVGMFVYRKQFLTPEPDVLVYEPWKFSYSASQLTSFI